MLVSLSKTNKRKVNFAVYDFAAEDNFIYIRNYLFEKIISTYSDEELHEILRQGQNNNFRCYGGIKCVEDVDVHSVDFADVDIKEVKNAKKI